jgi:hypothetical protein
MRRKNEMNLRPREWLRWIFHSLPAVPALLILALCSPAQDTSGSSGWVVIPVAEYRSLHAKAFPAEREPDPAPIDATLTRVAYDLRINGDLAVGQANLTVDVVKDGWVRIPIPSGLLIREAKLDGNPVALVHGAPGKSPGSLSAVLSRQGRALLQLDIALPVTSTAGNESVSLPPATSGITSARVELPRQGVDVKLSGGFLAEKSESAAQSRWLAYGRGSDPLVFTWRRKSEDHRGTQSLRLRGSLTELVGLGEDSTSVYAEVNAEVVQGVAREVSIRLPEKVTVNQVAGATVADWEVKAGELVVSFLEPVEQAARFVVTGETRTARDGQIDIPILRLFNAEREAGGVAVEVLGAGEIKDRKAVGLDSADAADLGETVSGRQSPSLVAFRFRSGDATAARSLAVNVARYAQESVLMANVEEARYQVLMTGEGKALIQAKFAIRNNQRNFLKMTLPAGAVIWSASLAGKPVRPGEGPDGSLLLPLEKARASEEAPAFEAEILYLSRAPSWNERGRLKLALPLLDLPVSRTGLLFYHPPLYRVNLEPGSFRVEKYQGPSSTVLAEGLASTKEEDIKSSSLRQPQSGPGGSKDKAQAATQALVDKFRSDSLAGKRAGILPIAVSFPAFGPSVFLVSELTAENQSSNVEFTYQREKKGGAR